VGEGSIINCDTSPKRQGSGAPTDALIALGTEIAGPSSPVWFSIENQEQQKDLQPIVASPLL
jgi:hypothetical protein